MNGRFSALLQWHLHRMAERLGVIGNLAIALLVLAVAAYLLLLRPLSSELDAVKAASQEPSKREGRSGISDAERYDAFEQALPSIATRPSAIQSLVDIAISEGLQPNEITYKTENRLNDPFSHYHVEFGLYAPYPDIQHFLSVLLHKLNFVSIESITYNRETVKDDRVEARVHLAFHFSRRNEPRTATDRTVVGGEL